MIKYEKKVEVESLYVDDNWRLTQEKVIKKLKIFGVTVWKNTGDTIHKLPTDVLFTTAVKDRALDKVGFGKNESRR